MLLAARTVNSLMITPAEHFGKHTQIFTWQTSKQPKLAEGLQIIRINFQYKDELPTITTFGKIYSPHESCGKAGETHELCHTGRKAAGPGNKTSVFRKQELHC